MKRTFFVYSVTIFLFIMFVNGARLYLAPLLFVILIFLPNKKYKIVVLIMLLVILNIFYRNTIIDEGEYSGNVTIKHLDYGSNNMLMILNGHKLIVQGSKINKPGHYYVRCKVQHLSKRAKESGFNEYNYYMSKAIIGKAKIIENKYISAYTDYNYMLKDFLFHRMEGYHEEKPIVFSMLFGAKKVLNENDIEIYKGIGILHLFVVSGIHIMVISASIDKLFKLFKLKKKYRDVIVIVFVLFIVYLTGFHVSALRSFIIVLIGMVEFYYLKKFDNIEKLSLATLLIMIFNPYHALSLSFILGSLCYFAITEKGLVYMYVLIFPILFGMGFKISLIYIISAIILTSIISKLLPFLMLSVIVSPLMIILRPIVRALHIIINYIYRISIINIDVFPFNTYSMIVFYSVFILFYLAKEKEKLYIYSTKNKQYILFISAFIIVLSQAIYFHYISRGIHFIDVGQGDSALIVTGRGSTILIDTGDKNSILSYLRNRGIDKVDHVFISHFDKDHSKMLDEIDYHKLYVSHKVKGRKSLLIKDKDIIRIDDYVFKIVHPKTISESDNKNSMCIYAYKNNVSVLFTGDISSDEVSNLKWSATIMKFPHHGSKYSLNRERFKMIGFDKCVISYGNNNYGHPSPDVISFLKSIGVEVYETYKRGSIHFKIR